MLTSLLLPNGCILRPGGRVRLHRDQVFEIPDEVGESLGLELDPKAWSYDTEVIVWPVCGKSEQKSIVP